MSGRGRTARALELALALGLGLALLALVFRGVSWPAFANALAGVEPVWLVASIALFVTTHASRGWRWMVAVRPVRALPFRRAYSIQAVGLLAIQALPFRLGELARPYLLWEREGVPLGGGMFAVVVDRSLDLVAVALLLTVAVAAADLPLHTIEVAGVEIALVQQGRIGVALALVPLLAVLAAVAIGGEGAIERMRGLATRVHPGLGRRLAAGLEPFHEGVRGLGSLRHAAPMAGVTLAAWILNALAVWALCRAMGFDDIDPLGGLVLLLVMTLGLMLPSAPFSIGIVEAFLVAGLVLLGIGHDPALAYAVVFRAINVLVVGGLGITFLAVDRISFRAIAAFTRAERDR